MTARIELAVRPADDGGLGTPVIVGLRGPLGDATADRLVDELCQTLTEHPHAVLDVSELTLAQAGAVYALVRAAHAAGEWPDVAVVLAAPSPALAARLSGSQVDRRVPVHPDVATALTLVGARPAVLHAFWHFAVTPRAPGWARGHVRRVCGRWDVDDQAREAAEIVVTELVTNAVEHAASASVVNVECSDDTFRLEVRDYVASPLPDGSPPGPASPRGRGLAMVAAVARSWGVDAHDDGKTVWAEMDLAG